MLTSLLVLAAGTLVSEDLTTVTAGLLVQRGQITFVYALVACGLGIYLGDLGLWAFGRLFGPRVLRLRRVASVLPPEGVDRFRSWFDAHTASLIAASRFAPGTRLPLYVAAGACRTSFRQFARWTLVVVAVWTPILLGISLLAGQQVSAWAGRWERAGHLVLLVSAGVVLIGWRGAAWFLSGRGRQRLGAAVARLWRWEFWPMWLFYAPVALWTLWLAIRHGGFGTIAAANPGIPDGGLVGESKFDILARLPAEVAIPAVRLPAGGIPAARRDWLRNHMQYHGWTWPLVLKPDVGQRGAGVRILRNEDDAGEYLGTITAAVVAQPYHPGPYEAGIFYYRRPGWARGRILSITDKHFPVVVGDGRSTLEDLVWAHGRYRMQARMFLQRLGARSRHVPAAGERVAIGLAGNHAQGAMFTDGRHLITAALEARIDAIARAYDGFFIGRFDIRYADPHAFMAGQDLAIVELNGATAECTNIYDPANSLWRAYRQLFTQWRLVFEIGAANRRAGRRGATAARLVALLRAHFSARVVFPVSD